MTGQAVPFLGCFVLATCLGLTSAYIYIYRVSLDGITHIDTNKIDTNNSLHGTCVFYRSIDRSIDLYTLCLVHDRSIYIDIIIYIYVGMMFSLFFILNLFVWGAGSDAAVPFGSMLLLVFMWFGVSVPLVFVGAYFGFRQPPVIEFPVSASNIPRPIPIQPWYRYRLKSIYIYIYLRHVAIWIDIYYICIYVLLSREPSSVLRDHQSMWIYHAFSLSIDIFFIYVYGFQSREFSCVIIALNRTCFPVYRYLYIYICISIERGPSYHHIDSYIVPSY